MTWGESAVLDAAGGLVAIGKVDAVRRMIKPDKVLS